MKKEFRIKKSDDILTLMKKKITVGNSYFVIYYQKNHDQKHFKFAISVPKKFGNAVQRNKMKRRIREIIKDESILPNIDFFVVAKVKSQSLDFSEIKKNIEKLLKKAKLLKDGKNEK
ncbi:ribonuclease P protein component [Mycoplasmatota bacterium]|nr:ribonuclease P protein component [Mycoplasmatota bacterium]